MYRSLFFGILAGVSMVALTGCPYSYTANDAGDAAWVEQVVPAVLGRKPINALETQVLVDVLQTGGRAAVVDVLMSLPEFDTYWSLVLQDAMKVQRSGVAAAGVNCFAYYAYPTVSGASTAVANTLVTQVDATATSGLPYFSLADVLRSSIAADDVFAPWRYETFVLGRSARVWDGVGRDVFLSAYTHRTVACLGCHTSTGSSAAISPIPMDMDGALFPGGMYSADLTRLAFGEKTGGGSNASVFGTSISTCAARLTTMSVDAHTGVPGTDFAQLNPTDPGTDCAWDQSGPVCESLDVLDIDAALLAGRAAANTGIVGVDMGYTQTPGTYFPSAMTVTGDEAFGSALAYSVTEALVKEVEGHGLTLPHGHPRVDEQRTYLQGYAWLMVSSNWSLRVPLKTMVLAGTFNMRPPSQATNDYPFPMYFNPWAEDPNNNDVYDNVNGQGDVVHRFSVPALLGAVQHSLGWTAPALNPAAGYPSKDFQREMGRYESYEETGYDDPTFQNMLLWEDVVGECINPNPGMDWVDYVVTEAQGNPSYTLEDVLLAMKDRFIQESDIDDGSVIALPDDATTMEAVADDGGGVDWDDIDDVKRYAEAEASLAKERSAQREKARSVTRALEAEIAAGEKQMAADTEAAQNTKEDPEAWRDRYDSYTKWLGDEGWTKTWSAYRDDLDEEGAYRLLDSYGSSVRLWPVYVYETEATKLADYFGVSSLGVSASTVPNLEDLLRGYCGVLTTTPQFMLGGMRRVQTAPDPVPALLVCLPTQTAWCDEHTLCTLYNSYLTAAGDPTVTCI